MCLGGSGCLECTGLWLRGLWEKQKRGRVRTLAGSVHLEAAWDSALGGWCFYSCFAEEEGTESPRRLPS